VWSSARKTSQIQEGSTVKTIHFYPKQLSSLYIECLLLSSSSVVAKSGLYSESVTIATTNYLTDLSQTWVVLIVKHYCSYEGWSTTNQIVAVAFLFYIMMKFSANTPIFNLVLSLKKYQKQQWTFQYCFILKYGSYRHSLVNYGSQLVSLAIKTTSHHPLC